MSKCFIEKVNEVLDSEVRQVLQRDGGDIVASSYKDGILYVELKGICACCRRANETISEIIEPTLKEYFPEIKAIVRS